MASTFHNPSLLDYPAAAEYLGIAEQTLRQWASQGRITYYKVGRFTKFAPTDLDAFLEAHRVPAIGKEVRR